MRASTVAAVFGLCTALAVNNPTAPSATRNVRHFSNTSHRQVVPKIVTISSPAAPQTTAPATASASGVPPAAEAAAPPVAAPGEPATTSPASNPNSCAAAISYLQTHANPTFRIQCPGYAAGHQAMTCINHSALCSGENVITIAVPCPASYENEARNSYVLTGESGYMGHALDEHPQGCPTR